MTSTGSDRDCAGGCGRLAPVVELMGQRIPIRYCEECGERSRLEEERLERERAEADALRLAGATERLLPYTLNTYPADLAVHLRAARAWLDAYRAGGTANLWVSGTVGAGKTGLAWGIVRAVVSDAVARHFDSDEEYRGVRPSVPAVLVNWRDLLADLRDGYDPHTGATGAAALYGRACRIPLLALDDVGAERPTAWALEQLAGLVQARYDRAVPTIVTSNFDNVELAKRLGHEDPVAGKRIVSRLTEGAVGIAFTQPSRRRAG